MKNKKWDTMEAWRDKQVGITIRYTKKFTLRRFKSKKFGNKKAY